MKTIMFDMDGVLADFILGFTACAASLFPNLNLQPFNTRDNPTWGFGRLLSPEQQDVVWADIRGKSYFWQSLRPLVTPADFARIATLATRNNVYFVTARPDGMTGAGWQTREWLNEHGVTGGNVIGTSRKGEAARLLRADFSIEDKIENAWCVHWMTDKPKTASVLINRQYNQFSPGCEIGPKGLVRVDEVSEFLSMVEEVA
tara:strand:- start:14 stop:619 length:606 start_codon:yes stop_codon:yes gene_type:complete